MVPTSFVELHDSTLAELCHLGSLIEIRLRPAYVHEPGSGWTQNVDLVISDGWIESAASHLPCDLHDGSLSVGAKTWRNVIPLILDSVGPVEFNAQTATGDQIVVRGSGAEFIRHGEPTWVEATPFDYNDLSPDYSER
jgi:hypothetical protein